jgi:uncharacterized repeat protein (TIGR02543 family)
MKLKFNQIVVFKILLLSIFVLVACNQQKSYKITFDTQTDEVVQPIINAAGEAIFAPDNPSRSGYRFDGWFYNNELYAFSVMPKNNITLVAQWSKYYQLIFDTGEGTLVEPIWVVEGDSIQWPEAPKRDHFKFTGWLSGGQEFNLAQMPAQNVFLTAEWTPATTITFVATVFDRHINQYIDIEIDSIVEIAGVELQNIPTPKYPEYKFVSWQMDDEDYDFDVMPEEDITLYANWIQLSNLPVLFINLYSEQGAIVPIEQVTRETYVQSVISLENTDQAYILDSLIAEFKGRGNGSWVDSGDKKGYRIKFDSKQSILGSSESKHWVILAGANFDDKTMYRNKFAFDMAAEIFDGIEYVSSAEWVDVYINGNYHGVYIICEHIRVDEDRVNIVSEYGVNDTGYFIEYDAYASGVEGVDFFRVNGLRYPFTMKSPSPEDYSDYGLTTEQYREQVSYIKQIVQNMVSAALAKDFDLFSTYADIASFVDIYILHELFKNIDTGYSSFYLYRHPGGKIFAGPPWDFDATWGSSPTRGNGGPTGIYVALAVQAFSSRTASELLISLYATPAFKQVVINRWQVLSPMIEAYTNQIFTDDMVETYKFALGRNYVRWPSPQGYGPQVSQSTAEANWVSNISIAKKWLLDRVIWLNNEWK